MIPSILPERERELERFFVDRRGLPNNSFLHKNPTHTHTKLGAKSMKEEGRNNSLSLGV